MVFFALARSLLFILLAALLWVSFSTSIMNFPSAADRENSEKHAAAYSCLYCKKLFTNHRALGGHLKSHNIEIKSRWRRHHASGSSISNNPNPISSNQPENCSGRAVSNLSKSYGSNEAVPMNATFAPSGRTAPTGVRSDPSLCLDLGLSLYGVCQYGIDEGQNGGNGISLFHGDAVQKFRDNLSKSSFPAFTVANPYSGFDLNQSPGFKETIAVGSFSMAPCPCLYKMKNFSTFEEGKGQYSLDALGNTDMMRSSKRPKIISNLPVESENSQNKLLPLFKDMEKPLSGAGISFDAEQEGPADIDLSLHL